MFAQTDELVICTHKPDYTGSNPRGIFWNRGSYVSIDAAVVDIAAWDAEPETTVYFSIGAFANHEYTDGSGRKKWRRRQEQATWFKTLALDLDVGDDKPYATQRDGWVALRTALRTVKFPEPMVVQSGKGLHCYWPLIEQIPRDAWVTVSTALRVALAEHNVLIDTTKINDASMILRPVGTHHKKQTPWLDVKLLKDSQDYDALLLAGLLKPWVSQSTSKASPRSNGASASSIASAVLNSHDVILTAVAKQCKQVQALVDSGGMLDAAGRPVQEPMWRASLGLANHCVDVPSAVVLIAGKHPDFDLQSNLDKLSRWKGTGPTTCAKFEQLCTEGCAGCPHKGKITSPAALSAADQSAVVTADGDQIVLQLPKGYVLRNKGIYKEVEVESDSIDANGNTVTVTTTDYEFVSAYEMHITGVYADAESRKSSFRLAIKYPMVGWKEEDHEMAVIATLGKDFSAFLLNRQVYIKTAGQQEKLRGYLMDYLSMVQSQAPSGVDFVSFGWQEDGSFLCGETVLGSPAGVIDRRLKGPASRFADVIKPHGTRDGWIEAMQMLNEPGSLTIRSAVLVATSGILGKVAGNASLVMSIYSTETTTGKSLALIAANSLIGTPRELFMNKNDTANALFKVRGVLNNLPCTIDELTAADDEDAVNLAYDLSQGREKLAMTRDRDLRVPVRWDGPTLVTTNISLHQKFETVQANNEPLKARTLEIPHHDRTFIQTDEAGSSNGYRFFDMVAKNNGWAFPELVEAVLAMGGPEAVWTKGEAAFLKNVGYIFEPQERFYRTAIIGGWIMGNIGKRLGLFPFDIEETITYLLAQVTSFRHKIVAEKQDAFDIVGQFLLEHNDKIVEMVERYGTGKETPGAAPPDTAVARLKIVYDTAQPVLPGSSLSISMPAFKKWLSKSKNSLDKVLGELHSHSVILSDRERVTLFRGCANRNPGQAHCFVINMNHPRFIESLSASPVKLQSPIALAVLQGGKS